MSNVVEHPMKNKFGNSPTDGDGTDRIETRVAVLETHVGYISKDLTEIKSDIKGLAGKIDSNFKWTITLVIAIMTLVMGGYTALIYHAIPSESDIQRIAQQAVTQGVNSVLLQYIDIQKKNKH